MIKLNLFKKKPAEFKSSKNTAIYKSIVNESTGRRKRDIEATRGFNEKKDNWEYFGRMGNMMLKQSEYKHPLQEDITLIKKRFKKKSSVDVMVLGAGEGIEAEIINNQLRELKLNIDTLSLTNSLSENAKLIVRKDYSPEKLKVTDFFEHFNHLKFVGKYDYIFSDLGVGYHTYYPEIALLKVGSMLRVGGFATIQIESGKNIKSSQKIVKDINDYLANKNLANKLRLTIINCDYNKHLDNVFSKQLKLFDTPDYVTYIRLERLK